MIYELVYCSFAGSNLKQEDIADILNTARDFNSKNNITGCLLYYNDEFVQILEGDEGMVNHLFSKIEKDKRHTDIILLAKGDKEKRVFYNWSMAYHKLNNDDVQDLGKEVFIDNFITFAKFASKPTFPTILFWTRVKHILEKK